MIPKRIVTLFTLASFLSCSKTANNNLTNNLTTDSTQVENIGVTEERMQPIDTATNCIREQAKSVIKKSVYPNGTFELNKDNRTGIEIVELANGDKLIINNWGCEYYALTFRFETTRFKADTTDTDYWIDKALVLMKETENGLDSPLDIPGGALAIKTYLMEKGEYKLGEWVMYGSSTIRNIVTIDKIQNLSDKRYAVEITYSIGPL